MNSSVLVELNDDGEFLRKGKCHPDNIEVITLDSDDETLNNNESKLEKEGIIAVIPAKKDENYVKVSLITKKGIIKEYIQEDDLGIIISDDGIILFHSNQLYHDGIQGSSRHFPLGTQVYFTSVVVRNKKLKKVSPNSTIEQALAVWDTRKPSDLVKLADDDTYLEELEENRDDFLDLFESDAFIPLSHYRIRGRIIGYLNADFGIIELDGSERFAKVLFHRSQVYLFRRKLSNRNCMLTDLPVGLKITIEATPITQDLEMEDLYGVEYIACYVIAGSWPDHPSPTILNKEAGRRTVTSYLGPIGATYFYLDQRLRHDLKTQYRTYLRDCSTRGFLFPDFEIRGFADFEDWKSQHSNYRPGAFPVGQRRERKPRAMHKHGFGLGVCAKSEITLIKREIKKEEK